jgi:hypothetical protein
MQTFQQSKKQYEQTDSGEPLRAGLEAQSRQL